MAIISKLISAALFCGMAHQAYAADAAAPAAPAFDMGISVTGVTNYMDYGLTQSNNQPSLNVTLSPSYGIFYGNLSATTIDYGVPEPRLETKISIGVTPTFGHLAVDFNLQRRMRLSDPQFDRWLPYITATYTLNDNFTASLGGGDYLNDDPTRADFLELYIGSTIKMDNGASLVGEFYFDPKSDISGAFDYSEYIATATIPFLDKKFEAIGKLGYEQYDPASGFASYLWYRAGLNYNLNDHLIFGVAYTGNNLAAGADCIGQAWTGTGCDSRLLASITIKGNLSDLSK